MKQEFILEGLNCPNCAARIEADVRKLPEVASASLNLMKQMLTLQTNTEESLFSRIENIVHRYEPDVIVREKSSGHSQDPSIEEPDVTKMLLRMGIGAVLFAAALLLGKVLAFPAQLCLYVLAYGVLGYDVVLSAVKNIVKGHVFGPARIAAQSTAGHAS